MFLLPLSSGFSTIVANGWRGFVAVRGGRNGGTGGRTQGMCTVQKSELRNGKLLLCRPVVVVALFIVNPQLQILPPFLISDPISLAACSSLPVCWSACGSSRVMLCISLLSTSTSVDRVAACWQEYKTRFQGLLLSDPGSALSICSFGQAACSGQSQKRHRFAQAVIAVIPMYGVCCLPLIPTPQANFVPFFLLQALICRYVSPRAPHAAPGRWRRSTRQQPA